MTRDTIHDSGADSSSNLLEGELVGKTLGNYRLVRKLADGGMSQVYLADQIDMERWAAVKVLQVPSATLRARFRNEVKAVSRLGEHPNIVTVFNFGELDDGVLYLAMEYVDGRDLSKIVKKERLTLARAANIAEQTASALSFAHSHGIIHRDLKPHNIVVTKAIGGDNVKVLDFGLAMVGESQDGQTPTGVVVGTPQYLSPEQCLGRAATHLSDQYSLGLVFFELVTGQPAYQSDTVVGYLKAHTEGRVPHPSSLVQIGNAAILDDLILRMLEKDPNRRFPDMQAVHQRLVDICTRLRERPDSSESLDRTASSSGGAPDEGEQTRQDIRIPVRLIGPSPLSSQNTDRMLSRGFRITPKSPGLDAVYSLLVADERSWKKLLGRGNKVDLARSVIYVDAPVESMTALAAVERANNTIVGPGPIDSTIIEAGLWWLRSPTGNLIDNLMRPGAIASAEIVTSDDKSRCADQVLADMNSRGMRRGARSAAKSIVEEMALNALVHAPSPNEGHKTTENVKPALLRWAINDEYVALSLRDSFGTLTPSDLLSSKFRTKKKDRKPTGDNAGLGLEIIAKAATHLIYSVAPGSFCEILALLRIADGRYVDTGSSLTMLTFTPRERQVGDRLWIREASMQDGQRFYLEGELNETSDLSSVYSRSGMISLDLRGVTAINSRGVVAWFRAIEARNPTLRLLLENCSPPVVHQLNMMSGLAPRGEIASILLPYYCDGCDIESTQAIELAGERTVIPAPPVCERCGERLELDEPPETYLEFLE